MAQASGKQADASRLDQVLEELCRRVGVLPNDVLHYRRISVKSIDVAFLELEEDADHFYINFDFGAVAAGRTLTAFRLMLESNILVYARESGVMGVDSETGNAVLSIRTHFGPEICGDWLSDTLSYFAEHAHYWQRNILECNDEMLNGITSGKYQWLKA